MDDVGEGEGWRGISYEFWYENFWKRQLWKLGRRYQDNVKHIL